MHDVIKILKDRFPDITLPDGVKDVRLRVGKRIVLRDINDKRIFSSKIVSKSDLESIFCALTGNARYLFEDELAHGYLHGKHGARIGVAGNYRECGGKLYVAEITSLDIRIPHEIIGVADKVADVIYPFDNTLIVSPPSCGKTTLLRDMTRRLTRYYDVVAIDERYELFGENGDLNSGYGLDVIKGVPKSEVDENVIRALSPDIVVFDELYGERDDEVVSRLCHSGVKILATMHGSDPLDVEKRLIKSRECFSSVIYLHSIPSVGSIKSIVRR